jgi:DNA-binding MarR family transcriptional regulator
VTEDRRSKKGTGKPGAEPLPEIRKGVLPNLLGYMLRQSQLLVYQAFQAAVNDESVRPPQFSILEIISCNPGVRPSDVAASIGVSRANLVPLLAELEKAGFITRSSNREDGRAQALHLTQAGEAQLKRLHDVIITLEDRLAEFLGPDRRETLLQLLHDLNTGAAKT